MVLDLVVRDHVATVTLNRPEALNAINAELRASLHEVWKRIRTDDDIRVGVLTGAGSRAFCVGSDLKEGTPPGGSHAYRTFGSSEPEHLLDGLESDKPLICAVNGFAIGGGLELALACDIRVASHDAEFGLAEVRIGSMPGAGGTYRLPRAVGSSLAMQMMLTGDRIGAEVALRAGLVSELHAADRLMERASAIAERIAMNAPLSVRAIKRLANHSLSTTPTVARDLERFAWGLLRDTEDRQEGRQSFREKRPPKYRGR